MVIDMTGNDVVRVLDEMIDGYKKDWYSSSRSQYESNKIVVRLTELQRMLHEAMDDGKIEQRLQKYEENR